MVDTAHVRQYQLAYEEGLRSIAEQQAALQDIRERTGTVISAATIGTSFLGGLALQSGELSWAGGLAIALFVVSGGLAVSVLWPRAGWRVVFDPRVLVDDWIEGSGEQSDAEMYRDLAVLLGENSEYNEGPLLSLLWRFRIATLLLLGEVVAWLVDLGGVP